MDLLSRRSVMLLKKGKEPDIIISITSFSGSGADRTTNIIDATERDAYIYMPFVSGDSRLVASATPSSLGVRDRLAALYTDAEATNFVGYYNPNTGTIVSSRPTTANCPWLGFDEEVLAIPRGYYGKLMICRSGSAAFSSNANCANYVRINGYFIMRA